MTPKKDRLYWYEFSAVTQYCKENQIRCPDRHELHVKALGEDKSHKDFSDEDFDKYLAVCRAISRPTSLKSQLRQLNQATTRIQYNVANIQIPCLAVLMYLAKTKKAGHEQSDISTYLNFKAGRIPLPIEEYAPAEHYVAEVMQDKFRTSDLTQVSSKKQIRGKNDEWEKSDLELLRDTIDARINDLRKASGLTIHEMNTLAGVKCSCSQCKRIRAREQKVAVAA